MMFNAKRKEYSSIHIVSVTISVTPMADPFLWKYVASIAIYIISVFFSILELAFVSLHSISLVILIFLFNL